jgi:hypothetical protein
MSKKSRRRNKKIAALLGGLGAAMLLGRGRGTTAANVDSGRGSGLRPTVDSMPKNIDKVIQDVSTPTTIQDSMPRVGMRMGDIQPKNVKSKRILPNTNKVFTIEGAKKGIAPKVGNVKSAFVGDDGLIRQGVNATPMTPGRFGTFRAAQEIKRGMLPPQLRVPKVRTPVIDDSFFSDAMAKDGGKIVKTETGGKAVRPKKKNKIQIKGFGKARR